MLTTCTLLLRASLHPCRFIAAVFLPPLGVFLEVGCGKDFLINCLLTLLIWIPGAFDYV